MSGSKQYDDTDTFIAFRNERAREGKNDAPYTGTLDVGGRKFFMDIWVRESTKRPGEKFLSGRIKEKTGGSGGGGQARTSGGGGRSDLGDDIPF